MPGHTRVRPKPVIRDEPLYAAPSTALLHVSTLGYSTAAEVDGHPLEVKEAINDF